MSLIRNRLSSYAAAFALLIVATAASPAVADSTYALSNATNGDGTSHAFWLPPDNDPAAPGTYYHWVTSSNPTLTFNGSSWANSTSAVMTGQIQEATGSSPNSPISGGSIFDVELHFTNGVGYDDWTGDIKNENGTSSANVQGWQIFTLDNTMTNQLSLVSGPGQSIIPLGLFQPSGMTLGFQVGIGASMKSPNDVLGASGWVSYTDTEADPDVVRRGDINIELTVVPTPSAALGSLALFGLLGVRPRRAL